MARALSVTVKADIGAYSRAMQRAGAETDNFSRKMSHVGRAGMAMSRLGDTMTRRVTLPIIAVGAAATKMALDFDKSFTQMQTLAGLTAGDVDALKESVLDLSGQTGKSPRELAEALYFLRSSGLDGAAALEALEVSAKGSAAGLGPVVQVADAVSSAMLAYAESGLTAAEATDVLVATAREGKVEPAELATQMGRLVPVASELGITFGDVGGAIAALSTKGNNAEQATTQLTQVMMKLLKPSKQAEELLDGVGLSAEALRGMIAEKGLLGTLEELRARLGDAGFVKFLEDSRAVQGGLALLGGDLGKTREIFDAVGDSAGATEQAFEIWGKSLSGQTSKAIADFQVGLIQIGEIILPIAADILSFAATIAQAFSGLPDLAKTAIVGFGLVLAAIGPLLSIGGRLMQTYATIASTFSTVGTNAATLGRTLARGGLLVGGLLVLDELLDRVFGETGQIGSDIDKLTTSLTTFGRTGALTGEALKIVGEGFEGLTDALADPSLLDRANDSVNDLLGTLTLGAADVDTNVEKAEQTVKDFDDALASIAASDPDLAFSILESAADAAGISVGDLKDRLPEYSNEVERAANESSDAAGGLGEVEEGLGGVGEAAEEAVSALQEYVDTLKGMFDPQFAMIDAMQGSVEAQQELRAATDELNAARESGDVERLAEAETRYADAVSGARRSVVDLRSAAAELKDSMDAQGLSADDVTAKFVDLATQQGFTAEEALIMAEAFGVATDEAGELNASDPVVDVSQTGAAQTREQIDRVRDVAVRTGQQRPNVRVKATDSASAIIGGIRERLAGLPSSKTITVTTLYRESGLRSSTLGKALAKQHGGPVRANQAYVVGETQPELFIPDRDGMILPSVPSKGFGTPWGGGGGGGVGYVDNRTINITTGADPQQVVAALRRAGEIGIPITIRGRTL